MRRAGGRYARRSSARGARGSRQSSGGSARAAGQAPRHLRPSCICRRSRGGRPSPASRRPRRYRARSPWSARSSCRRAAVRRPPAWRRRAASRACAPLRAATPASAATRATACRRRSRETASDRGGRASARSRGADTRPRRRWSRPTARQALHRPRRSTPSRTPTAPRDDLGAVVHGQDCGVANERGAHGRPARCLRRGPSVRWRQSSGASRSSTSGSRQRPRRMAISSATMLIAISAGVIAPMSRPIGACTRCRHSAGMPSASRASLMRTTLARLPIRPT